MIKINGKEYEEKEEFSEIAHAELEEMYTVVKEMINNSIEYFVSNNDMYLGFIIQSEEKLDALTEKAKKALDIANRLSKNMHYNYVGTEHILAGLLKEGTGPP